MDCPRCGLINPDGALRCDCGYVFGGTVARVWKDGRPAPHARRFVAFLIDMVAFWVPVWLASLAFGEAGLRRLLFPLLVAYWVYLVLSWGLAGQSAGKWLMDLHIVGPRGGCPGLGRAFTRLLAMNVLSFLGVTWWPVMWRDDRRALHDLVAGTRVTLGRPTTTAPGAGEEGQTL